MIHPSVISSAEIRRIAGDLAVASEREGRDDWARLRDTGAILSVREMRESLRTAGPWLPAADRGAMLRYVEFHGARGPIERWTAGQRRQVALRTLCGDHHGGPIAVPRLRRADHRYALVTQYADAGRGIQLDVTTGPVVEQLLQHAHGVRWDGWLPVALWDLDTTTVYPITITAAVEGWGS